MVTQELPPDGVCNFVMYKRRIDRRCATYMLDKPAHLGHNEFHARHKSRSPEEIGLVILLALCAI